MMDTCEVQILAPHLNPFFSRPIKIKEVDVRWITEDFKQYIEVRPQTDTKQHLAGDECWCKPLIDRDNGRPIIIHKERDMDDSTAVRELTFGERAVGLTFNPSNKLEVQSIKEQFASLLDNLNEQRNATEDGEVKRMLSVAITEAQTAQMWAVKAVTWN